MSSAREMLRYLMVIMAICAWSWVGPAAGEEAPAIGGTARDDGDEEQHHRQHETHGERQHGDHATVQHRFEDAEHWAERFEDPERDAWQQPDVVLARLVTRDDLWIADIGSATGYFPVRFARAVPRGFVYGVDIEPDMVFYLNDRARREALPNLASLLADDDDPHLPQPVDLIFICNTYHHIDGRIDYFRRLALQLRPGGQVAIVDFRPGSAKGPPHKLAPEVVEREMLEAGYRLADRVDDLPEQYFLVFTHEPTR